MIRFWLQAVLQLGAVAFAQSSPCDPNNHYTISTNGFRSSDYDASNDDILICDDNLTPGSWYRFDLDAGTQLYEKPADPFHCGTQAPIWMNSTHPTDDKQVVVQVCATYAWNNYCGWSRNVTIQFCNAAKEPFYVYKLAVPEGCSLAYCVDASTRKECQPPLVWLPDEYQCGMPPDSDGWGPWSSWSNCDKPCDFGEQTRKRTCLKFPCTGESQETQPCNEYNCAVAFVQSSPCDSKNHDTISTNGFRSSDFDSRDTDILICDDDFSPDTWYRFDLDAGTQLYEKPAEPFHCGTDAPIWMNGTHPTDDKQVVVQVCSTYSETDYCKWSGNVTIQFCNTTKEAFYVYKLAVPGGCSLAYCVDASTRKKCQDPLVWLPHEYQCGRNETPPTTTRRTTVVTPTTVPPDSDGWGPWSSWTACDKPCDFGEQTRKRNCPQFNCVEGKPKETQLCNEYNCAVLEEEKLEGAVIEYDTTQEKKKTMTVVAEKEEEVNELIRSSLNEICSANMSRCCGTNVKGHLPDGIAFVTSEDVFTAQGYPRYESDNDVIIKVVAVISDFIYSELCQDKSEKRGIVKRQTGKRYLPYEIMSEAIKNSESDIQKKTGLSLTSGPSESYPIEDIDDNDDADESCPVATCIIPIVVSISLAAILIVVLTLVICKCCKSSKIEAPPPAYGADGQVQYYEVHYGTGSQIPPTNMSALPQKPGA